MTYIKSDEFEEIIAEGMDKAINIPFVKDEKEGVVVEMVTPEVIRILAGTGHVNDFESLNPFDENNKVLHSLKAMLEGDHIFTVIGGSKTSRYIIFIDKSLQKTQ